MLNGPFSIPDPEPLLSILSTVDTIRSPQFRLSVFFDAIRFNVPIQARPGGPGLVATQRTCRLANKRPTGAGKA
jgi:hypothetical protein